MADLVPKEYTVTHRDRAIRFNGVQLAFESSDEPPEKLRWFEITIYKTVGGNYIAERVGRSRVYHRVDGCTVANGGDTVLASDLDQDELPCPRCNPLPKADLVEDAVIVAEVDRPTVETWPTAEKFIHSLYVREKTDSPSGLPQYRLPKVVDRALAEASKYDDALREAHAIEYVA